MVFYEWPQGTGFNPLHPLPRFIFGHYRFLTDSEQRRRLAMCNLIFSGGLSAVLLYLLASPGLPSVRSAFWIALINLGWHFFRWAFLKNRTEVLKTVGPIRIVAIGRLIYLFDWLLGTFSMALMLLVLREFTNVEGLEHLLTGLAMLTLALLLLPLAMLSRYQLEQHRHTR